MYVCTRTRVPETSVKCLPQHLSSLPLSQDVSLNLELIPKARLNANESEESSCLGLPSDAVTHGHRCTEKFARMRKSHAQVLMLAQLVSY